MRLRARDWTSNKNQNSDQDESEKSNASQQEEDESDDEDDNAFPVCTASVPLSKHCADLCTTLAVLLYKSPPFYDDDAFCASIPCRPWLDPRLDDIIEARHMSLSSAVLAILSLSLFSPALASVPAAKGDLWVSTPDNPTSCASTSIVFCGGTPPYRLQAILGANYDGVIEDIALNLSGAGQFEWT